MSTAANDNGPAWRSLASVAAKMDVTPAWLREQCKLLGVPIEGTPRTPLVSVAMIDAAWDRRAAARLAGTAEEQTIARAVDSLPMKKRSSARG